MIKIQNNKTGQEICLEETEDINKLKDQLVLLGMNGLFYSPWAREIQNKIGKVK